MQICATACSFESPALKVVLKYCSKERLGALKASLNGLRSSVQLIVDDINSNASADIPARIAKDKIATENRSAKQHDGAIGTGGTEIKQLIPENCVRIDMSSSPDIAKVCHLFCCNLKSRLCCALHICKNIPVVNLRLCTTRKQSLKNMRDIWQKDLLHSVLPFWLDHSVDW